MAAPARDVQMIRVAPDAAADAVDANATAATPLPGGPRDVASLFPKAAKKAKEDAALEAAARMREAIGANRFVKGETVLLGAEEEEQAAAASAGATAGGGDLYPYSSKSLAEQLQERKDAKEQERDEQRRLLERGGARPLDPDELEFLGRVRDAEEAAERRRLAEEASGVAEYRRAVEALQAVAKRRREGAVDEGEEKAAAVEEAVAAAAVLAPKPAATKSRGLPLPLVVVVSDKTKKKQKTAVKKDEAEEPKKPEEEDEPKGTAAPAAAQPPPTLGGLLGAYGSSSSEEEEGGD